VNSDGTCDITYEDGDKEKGVKPELIRLIDDIDGSAGGARSARKGGDGEDGSYVGPAKGLKPTEFISISVFNMKVRLTFPFIAIG
jgi:hypothetical protein